MRIRFDRGTLVLDQITEASKRAVLDGAVWDPELAAWRLPASRLSELRGRLADTNVRNPSDTIAPARLEPAWEIPELRWYQWEAVDRDEAHAGARLAYGRSVDLLPDFAAADVILAVESDFSGVGTGTSQIRA